MKRFLSTFFITLALVVSAAGVAPAAHADDIECTLDNGGTACAVDGVSGICSGDENSGPYCRVTGTFDSTSFSDPAAAGTAKGYEPEKSNDSIFAGVMQSIMKLFAWLVGVAALTLDYAVFYTVVKMGDYVNNLSAVGVTWQIMRDIGNIVIIFGFLAIGISTILNTERIGYGKKMLPMLLVAAVFLNFSLFLTEAVIDTGNLFATQFYTQIKGGQLPTAESLSGKGVLDAVEKEGISNKIMGQLGLQTIYTAGRVNTKVFESGNSLIIGFMGIILFLVTAFVLFSLAFVLIARFVILLFLIIVAPIGFAGLAVPKLESTAKLWWHKLFEQTITAPVLLLCLYIALAVITDAQFLVGFGSKSEANGWTGYVQSATGFDNLPGFGSVMISFLVAMGLLLAVVIISKKMSAFGGAMATKAAGAISFGAVSLGGRATLGMIGVGLANKRMQAAARKGGLGGLALKTLVLGGKGLRSSTYDFRNAPGVAKGSGLLNVETGEGAKLTAKQAHEAQYGWKPTKEWFDQSKAEREQAGREVDFKNAQADLAAGRISQDQFDAIATPILSKMTTKQLEELGGIRKGTEALVKNLSPEQFEALMKSDKFNEVEKEKMREGRYSSLHGAIVAGDRDAVRQWSAKDLATAAPDILNNPVQAASFVSLMSEGQFDAVVKDDKLTKIQQQQLRNFSGQGKIDNFLDIASGRPPRTPALVTAGIIPAGMVPAAAAVEARRLMGTMNPKKFAKLPGRILTDPIAMSLLTPKHLAAFMTDGDLDPGQISTIAVAVRNPAHPNHAAIDTYLNPATNPIAASYWV